MIAKIDDSVEIFTLISTFHTSRDRQAAIVDFLRRFTADFAKSLPEVIGASVHVSLDGARVVNYVQWRSSADIWSMLATPQAKAHIAEVGALANRVDPVAQAKTLCGASGKAAQVFKDFRWRTARAASAGWRARPSTQCWDPTRATSSPP